MKAPIFMLTKRERRVVIILVMALVAGAIARHYRDAQSHVSSPALTIGHGTESSPSPVNDDRAAPDETP